MSSFEELLDEVVGRAVRRELVAAAVERPAPYQIGVSIEEAARLLGVGRDKIRELISDGRLRTTDVGGARKVIPTLALFELDPGFDPERHVRYIEA